MKKISKLNWFTILTFAIGFLIPALGFLFPNTFFSNQQQVSQFIKNFGWWSPIIFVGLSIIPVIFTPLNHGIFGIVGGFVFGPWVGFILNWISKSIGTIITFSIGRFLGKKAISKFTKSEDMIQYNKIFNQHAFLIFIGFTINDTLSYLAGISTMKTKTFFFLILTAHIIPTLTLAYIGSGVSLKDPIFIILTSIIVLLAVSYFLIKKNQITNKYLKNNQYELRNKIFRENNKS
ncbi:TPA: hypothetical protein DCQ85_01805 [Candidatus Magasanikbacteria bacterium]|nr:MAG: hypothetical protein A2507_03100 [Candidatus Magasanikbacteria bacterium RIFOXYD12_FULL_33_17]HAO52181.1 hypothetical protein [Candidatus Magasanikbacteria bacterium]